jgi:hypothetical protein
MDSDTINEIVLSAASPAEENTLDMRKRKLESLQFQKEVIIHLLFVLSSRNKFGTL